MSELVMRAASGDEEAWDALCRELEPALAITQPRTIVRDVLARVRANQFERLKLYLDARRRLPDLAIETWLRVVAKRAAIDDARGSRAAVPPSVGHLLGLAAAQLREPQLSAIELWVQGVPLAVIAHELGLGDAAAAVNAIERAITQMSSKIVVDLTTERQSAEAHRERELACARFELLIAARAGGTIGGGSRLLRRASAALRTVGGVAGAIELSAW
jgi:hypothetical protein